MEKLDYDDFKDKFGPWAESFRPFIESKAMFDIYQKLKTDAQTDVIVPRSTHTFRAFSTTRPDDLKVIFYLMDPYPRMYKGKIPQATGIAMDCSNSPDGRLQSSLIKFYEGMSLDLGHDVEKSPSLEYLHEQGVMMLNTDLTCKKDMTGSHRELWDPFQKYFLEEILRGKQLIFVLCGKESHRMEKYISPFGNEIFKLEHPQNAGYNKTDWKHEKIFTKINKILGHNYIFWDKKEWDEGAPF